jgi:hypothetical protein
MLMENKLMLMDKQCMLMEHKYMFVENKTLIMENRKGFETSRLGQAGTETGCRAGQGTEGRTGTGWACRGARTHLEQDR